MTRVLIDARKARDFGIGRYVLGLLRALARRGDFALSAVVFPDDVPLLPAGVTPVLSTASHYSVRELLAIRRAMDRTKPDLFHAPHYVVPLAPAVPTVVTIHDLMHLRRPEHAGLHKRAYAAWMIRRAVRLAVRIVTVSEETRRDLLSFDSRAAGKTVVIPNGAADGFFRAGNAAAPPREGSSPYLLFVGNDKPHKNLDGLLLAFARIRATHPHLELRLAGVAAGRRAADGVHALGFVPDEDLADLVAGAEVLVLPSFAEGFGLPVLEAQAAGTPVACSDLPALREASGGVAAFFDPSDPASIARMLEGLLGDEAARSRLRAAGRVHAAAFTWDRVAENTVALYREALGR
ncbi:MAG: glycosyltransferase family 4 protein [Thermoanaerobaculia bacterium]